MISRGLILFFCCILTTSMVPAYAETAREYFEAGLNYLRDGHAEEGIEQLELAVQVDPNIPQIHNVLGVAYLQVDGQVDSAVAAFEEAVRIDPSFAEAHANLGIIFAQLEPDRAVQHFERAIEADPSFERALFAHASLQMSHYQNFGRAIDLFESVVAVNPKNAEAYHSLGLCYISKGKPYMVLKPISMLNSIGRLDLARSLEDMIRGETFPQLVNEDEVIYSDSEGS